jgi:hypothetical protein
MLRKVVIGICYFIAIVFILSVLWPAFYCFTHGCKGPDLDAFMPAFFLTPLGGITTGLSLLHTVQQIRKGNSAYWPLAVIFSIVLLGVFVFIAWMVYHTVLHR